MFNYMWENTPWAYEKSKYHYSRKLLTFPRCSKVKLSTFCAGQGALNEFLMQFHCFFFFKKPPFFLHNGSPHVVSPVCQLCFILVWECLVSSGQWQGHSLIRTGRSSPSACVCVSSLLRSGSNQSKLRLGAHIGPKGAPHGLSVCADSSQMSPFY